MEPGFFNHGAEEEINPLLENLDEKVLNKQFYLMRIIGLYSLVI